MTATVPAKAPSHTDVRTAKQLLDLLPVMGRLWSNAIREGGSVGRFKTFGVLGDRGPLRAGELATLCGTTPSAMTEAIEGLAADGFVRRIDDPTDRRAVMVELTESGHRELDRVRELMIAAAIKVIDGFTTDQKARLRTAVGDLSEILIPVSAQKETRHVR